MITAEQAAAYLDEALGITVPGFFLDAAIERVATVEGEMSAALYSDAQQVMVQSMAVAIIAAAGAPRRVQSQGAPSGASRSFKHFDNALSALRRSLKAADPRGITAAIVGPDPRAATLFFVTGDSYSAARYIPAASPTPPPPPSGDARPLTLGGLPLTLGANALALNP